MSKRKISKGELLQSKGDLNTKVYRVVSGLLRSYTIDSKGKEHTFMFAPEDWVMADSNRPEDPCELFIESLEDSELIILEKSDDMTHPVEKMIERMRVMQKRIILLLGAPAVERYEHFVKTYPDIVQRVPQKMIASYLGITPEALSKVKKEWLRSHNA